MLGITVETVYNFVEIPFCWRICNNLYLEIVNKMGRNEVANFLILSSSPESLMTVKCSSLISQEEEATKLCHTFFYTPTNHNRKTQLILILYTNEFGYIRPDLPKMLAYWFSEHPASEFPCFSPWC